MLTEKESKNNTLSVAKETRVKIIRMKPAVKTPHNLKKESSDLFPPRDQFNTRYIKARDRDPL
jgi:hypothetical protein